MKRKSSASSSWDPSASITSPSQWRTVLSLGLWSSRAAGAASRDRGDGAHLGGLTWQAHAAVARLHGETGRRELVAARARAIVGRLAGGIEDSRTRGTISQRGIQANPD